MKRQQPEAGEVYEFGYPFVRDKATLLDDEGCPYRASTWTPGTRMVDCGPSDVEAVADGMGVQKITVLGVYRPGKFPLRVFFTRQWSDPDGKVFGKGNCRVTTINAFRSLVNGFRHEFRLISQQKRIA